MAELSGAASESAGGIKQLVKKSKLTHPSTADMTKMAIKTLAERNGSSLRAIKKYIASTYQVDTDKHALFIKKYLKSAVVSSTLVQTRGKGASGSFKLAGKKFPLTKPKSNVMVAKRAAIEAFIAKEAKAAAKGKAKRVTSLKKIGIKKIAEKKKVTEAKVKKAVELKSSKAKKMGKGPIAKPKTPKPKKTAVVKKVRPLRK